MKKILFVIFLLFIKSVLVSAEQYDFSGIARNSPDEQQYPYPDLPYPNSEEYFSRSNNWILVYDETENNDSANRIRPTNNLGLFIDKELFVSAMKQSDVNFFIEGMEYGETSISHSLYIKYHLLENGEMVCLLDDYGKISGISLTFPASVYEERPNTIYFYVDYILQISGLPFSKTEYNQAIKNIKSNKKEYVNDSYGIVIYETGWDDIEEVDVDIFDSYWFTNREETPYSRMQKYYGNCDHNYIGACVPNVSLDLDCSDIGVRNFFVVGKDIHHFDSDGNGICCEPYPVRIVY